MINDYLDPRNAEGMPNLADSALALEFMISAKMGARNLAFAITETTSPRVRDLLRLQLAESLALHREIGELMMNKGWFKPYHLDEQFDLDVKSSDTMVKIANLDLFPADTSRWGTFATPNI